MFPSLDFHSLIDDNWQKQIKSFHFFMHVQTYKANGRVVFKIIETQIVANEKVEDTAIESIA